MNEYLLRFEQSCCYKLLYILSLVKVKSTETYVKHKEDIKMHQRIAIFLLWQC